MPSKVILIVIEFMFVCINIFWALLRAYFNPRLAAQAKMCLSRAQNIFMLANINSIVILTLGPVSQPFIVVQRVGHYGAYRDLKQPRRRRQQKPDKFAYLTIKNSIFARFARAFFSFWHFEDVLVLSTTWNDLFCSCVDDVSIWWQMFNFVFLCAKRWLQFNSRVVRTHFSSIMTLNN